MGMKMQKNAQDEGGKEVVRGGGGRRRCGGGGGGGRWGVTEMLKDERGGGEIISHYKLREQDAPWRSIFRGERETAAFKSSESRTFSHIPLALAKPFPLPLHQLNKPRNVMKIMFKEDNTGGPS